MKFGSLFSGIGGFDLAFERAGMECAWQCEIDPKAQEVLKRHWSVPIIEDVRNVTRDTVESVDLICGGFPCQDVSLAGERLGLDGKRSTLWSEFSRIICEFKPRWVVVENVRGLLSANNGQFFGNILRDLSRSGYDAEWKIIRASDFGAPHQRERIWIVAYPNGTIGFDGILQTGRNTSEEQRKACFWGADWRKFTVESRPAAILQRFTETTLGQSPLVRMDDGIPAIVDRLHQLGNAVVPQVAEWIGRRIVEVSK